MIWSDESAFNVGGLSSSGQVWVTWQAGKENIEDCLVPKFKKLQTIIVWACFKGRQKGPLIFWDKEHWGKTIKAVSFSSHIVPHFHQFWQEQSQLQLDYVYFQQDGASPYQAAHTQNLFRTLGIWGYFIDWPPSSPDCSPIENLQRTIKQRIRLRNPFPTTNEALRTAIEEEWAAITPDELEALVDTIPTRLREVKLYPLRPTFSHTNYRILYRFVFLRVATLAIKEDFARGGLFSFFFYLSFGYCLYFFFGFFHNLLRSYHSIIISESTFL